jgi:hypothetical protein
VAKPVAITRVRGHRSTLLVAGTGWVVRVIGVAREVVDRAEPKPTRHPRRRWRAYGQRLSRQRPRLARPAAMTQVGRAGAVLHVRSCGFRRAQVVGRAGWVAQCRSRGFGRKLTAKASRTGSVPQADRTGSAAQVRSRGLIVRLIEPVRSKFAMAEHSPGEVGKGRCRCTGWSVGRLSAQPGIRAEDAIPHRACAAPTPVDSRNPHSTTSCSRRRWVSGHAFSGTAAFCRSECATPVTGHYRSTRDNGGRRPATEEDEPDLCSRTIAPSHHRTIAPSHHRTIAPAADGWPPR